MNTAPNNTQRQEQFNFGHLSAIALCAVLLISLSVMKNGFVWPSFIASSAKQKKVYTYEQAQADALAEMNGSAAAGDSQRTETQIAMLDPASDAAQVLGASTGTEDSVLPNAADILTPQVLNNIKLTLVEQTNAETVLDYKKMVAAVESQDGVEKILVDLGSSDPKVLIEGSKMVEPLVKDLLQVPVPKDLAQYHKIKLIYYLQLSELADGYAGVQNVADPKDTGINIFAISELLNKLQTEIQNKYGVQL